MKKISITYQIDSRCCFRCLEHRSGQNGKKKKKIVLKDYDFRFRVGGDKVYSEWINNMNKMYRYLIYLYVLNLVFEIL